MQFSSLEWTLAMTRNRLRSIITGEDSWILRLLEINLWTLIRILFSCFQREFFSMGWEKNSSKVEAFIAVGILSGPRLVELRSRENEICIPEFSSLDWGAAGSVG